MNVLCKEFELNTLFADENDRGGFEDIINLRGQGLGKNPRPEPRTQFFQIVVGKFSIIFMRDSL